MSFTIFSSLSKGQAGGLHNPLIAGIISRKVAARGVGPLDSYDKISKEPSSSAFLTLACAAAK